MTTKIKWRLGKLPDPQEVALLLDKGLLTKDEAREILFTQETQEDRDKSSLQEEIKFLRILVDKLSGRTQIVEVIKEIHKPYRNSEWYTPYSLWAVATTDSMYLSNGSSNMVFNLSNNTGSSLTSSMSYGETQETPSFTDIKTF